MRAQQLINAKGVTKARYEGLLARLSNEQAKSSTGVFGKLAEANVRYYLGNWSEKTLMSKNDFRARTMKSNDCRVKLGNKYYNIEIKTGCGDLSYNVEGVNETELIPDADFVAWIPLTRGVNDENFPEYTYIFTRAEFIQLLYKMGSVRKVKGEFIVPDICEKLNVRYVPARRWTQIASFENCTGKLEVLYNELDNTITLEQFVKEIEGRA